MLLACPGIDTEFKLNDSEEIASIITDLVAELERYAFSKGVQPIEQNRLILLPGFAGKTILTSKASLYQKYEKTSHIKS